ncbi:MAG: DUF4111 domain-containing protein [Chloroflexi bacterium]|nr:DUF4111 domain-containing protein [Chloroflexota bacterium]
MDRPPVPADVSFLLEDLVPALRDSLRERLLGLYLYGSAVFGDYDPGVSDVDLLAVLPSDLQQAEFEALETVHTGIAEAHTAWRDRVEVLYLSRHALATFRTERSPITVISPGEPLNTKTAGIDWLMNWWLILDHGVTLAGPPPDTFIAPVSIDEFITAVRDHAFSWGEWVKHLDTTKSHGYAILTLCRTLYTATHRAHVSKMRAAAWAAVRYPEWAGLIRAALAWRSAPPAEVPDPSTTLPLAGAFARFAIAELRAG